MALQMYFRDDLANILASAEAASHATAWAAAKDGGKDHKYLEAYREGYRAALMVVARALGLKSTIQDPGEKHELPKIRP